MGVGLVPYVKYQFVLGAIKHPMHRNDHFHRTQAGGKMTAGLCHVRNQKFPDFLAKQVTVLVAQPQQILMTVYLIQYQQSRTQPID